MGFPRAACFNHGSLSHWSSHWLIDRSSPFNHWRVQVTTKYSGWWWMIDDYCRMGMIINHCSKSSKTIIINHGAIIIIDDWWWLMIIVFFSHHGWWKKSKLDLVGGLEHFFYDFPIILGMSSSQLTWSPWFFRGVGVPTSTYQYYLKAAHWFFPGQWLGMLGWVDR